MLQSQTKNIVYNVYREITDELNPPSHNLLLGIRAHISFWALYNALFQNPLKHIQSMPLFCTVLNKTDDLKMYLTFPHPIFFVNGVIKVLYANGLRNDKAFYEATMLILKHLP